MNTTIACPQLITHGQGKRLVVDGAPFLMLGAELHNSSASGIDYLNRALDRVAGLGCNTVLAPVSWELIEPREGQFDFTMVEALLEGARQRGLKWIPLWFGTWKNGQSTYVPEWVKTDLARFPRALDEQGRATRTLTPLAEATKAADRAAFVRLITHLRERDEHQGTIIMVQVENESGILGQKRDFSPLGDTALAAEVPQALMKYLQTRELIPEFAALWRAAGGRSSAHGPMFFGHVRGGNMHCLACGFVHRGNHRGGQGSLAVADVRQCVAGWRRSRGGNLSLGRTDRADVGRLAPGRSLDRFFCHRYIRR